MLHLTILPSFIPTLVFMSYLLHHKSEFKVISKRPIFSISLYSFSKVLGVFVLFLNNEHTLRVASEMFCNMIDFIELLKVWQTEF